MPTHYDAAATHRLLDYPGLVDALEAMYRAGVDEVARLGLKQKLQDGRQNDWLILPAWQHGARFGIKLVSVFPNNAAQGLASIQGLYALFDGNNGLPLATIDGAALTLRKTSANSALASRLLAREDVETLVMLGAGELAPHLAMAHATVRPSLRRILIWNRSRPAAEAMAARLAAEPATRHCAIAPTDELEAAIRQADLVSAATMTKAPLIRGEWLKPGAHVDLVGGFRPDMREADDATVLRARLYCDARFTAVAEAGDLCDPIGRGIIDEAAITDLFQLARGERPGRQSDDEITLFKSGGGGHEDLASAGYLVKRAAQG